MTKKKVWPWMSKYVRLRDSIDYCKRNNLPLDSGVSRCCSCGKIILWRYNDAGHFISRGSGGHSGVYFDERNVNLQCKTCNAQQQGNFPGYQDFMLERFGQEVIDKLRWLDKNNSYKGKLDGLYLYYKQSFQELEKEIRGRR